MTTTETEESTEEEALPEVDEVPSNKGKGQLKKEVKAEWKVLKEEAKANFKEVMGQRKLIAKAQYTSEELKTT